MKIEFDLFNITLSQLSVLQRLIEVEIASRGSRPEPEPEVKAEPEAEVKPEVKPAEIESLYAQLKDAMGGRSARGWVRGRFKVEARDLPSTMETMEALREKLDSLDGPPVSEQQEELPLPEPEPEPEPATEDDNEKAVQDILREASMRPDEDTVKAVLDYMTELGVKSGREVKPDQRGEFVARVRAILDGAVA